MDKSGYIALVSLSNIDIVYGFACFDTKLIIVAVGPIQTLLFVLMKVNIKSKIKGIFAIAN